MVHKGFESSSRRLGIINAVLGIDAFEHATYFSPLGDEKTGTIDR